MITPVITAFSRVGTEDLRTARLGLRFGRMDPMSQLALLAVERLAVNFNELPRDRTAIALAAGAGSLSTDAEYWKGREGAGGPSPTLFAYALPSAPIGEIAIRHGLTGPNLCFIGGSQNVLPEAVDWLQRGEVDGCVCVAVQFVSGPLSAWLDLPPAGVACAVFIRREAPASPGPDGRGCIHLPDDPGQFDRDLESWVDYFEAQKLQVKY